MSSHAKSPAPAAPKPLRIGIVGAGAIVRQRHLPGLSRLEGVEILAVCNATYESAERFCAEHLPHATPLQNWADLIALENLDIIWIGTPPYLHATVAVSALEAGKHVFCQARMAMNLAEAEEMLAAAKRHPQLVTMLCPPPHALRGDLVVRKALADELLGPLHQVRVQSLKADFLDPLAPAHWRQRDELSGYNVLTLGIYAEVLQRWLGPVKSLVARGRVVTPERRGYPVHVPDFLHVLCAWENGVEGALEFSGVAAHAPADRIELLGRDGALTYDIATDKIEFFARGETEPELLEITEDLALNWRVEEDFIAAVRSHGQVQPRPSFEDGVRYMRVVQAVADSLELGREIVL
ncbi:MAG: Gfo/Idh/MocA family oxidoreductase [Verrucomicrobia bacterium]|nr:Gfo/Idh/MocA family oxidoreductase [Verrucomicrobiota bacterium]MBV9656866.1 Gfo/Idh/MocA family oxidoreductase [Verrucomicrobiota bacterium]